MEENKDIFDRLFSHMPFTKQHRQSLLYVLFGSLTTVVNLAVFWFFTHVVVLDALIANCISWFFAVMFSFLTSRKWVFRWGSFDGFLHQMITFYLGRLVTLGIEEGLLLVFVSILGKDAIVIKLLSMLVVLVLNYFISRYVVFKQKEK